MTQAGEARGSVIGTCMLAMVVIINEEKRSENLARTKAVLGA